MPELAELLRATVAIVFSSFSGFVCNHLLLGKFLVSNYR